MVKSLINESLEEQESIIHAITSSVRDAIVMINNEGNISFWNEASTEIFGFSKDEVIGKNLHELLVPKKFLNQHKQAFPLFRTSGEGSAIGKLLELIAIRKDGTEFPIELSLSSLRINNKWCAIGIIRDITDKKNVEDSLRKREEKYRKIFENVQDVFLQTDLEGNILEISPSIERYSSFTREELIGRSAENLYANPVRRQDLLKELREKGEVFDFELLLKNKHNREIWASLSAHNYYDKNGKLQGIEGSLRDISERKRIEETITRERILLRTLIDNLPDAIYVKDAKGRKIVANQADLEIMGVATEAEIIGKTDLEIFNHETGSQGYAEDMVILNKEKPILHFETSFTDSAGNHRWQLTTKVPLYDLHGKIIGLVGIGRNITERKKAELKVEKQAEELKQLNATKDKFFSIIAHDLINPFQAILGLSGLLIENYNEYDRQEIEEMLKDIESSSKRAYNLLENLLIWGRSQTNLIKFQPENIDLKEIVEDNLALVKSQSTKKHLHVHSVINTPCFAFADKNMIDTVIRNLITNAIKFTPQYGEIVISARKEDKNIEVSVKDTGVGMSVKQRDNIFRIDSKLNTPGTENETGSGLGLILCKDFVEKNGGMILVESEEGKGSTFRFTLPMMDQHHYGTGIQ